MFCLECGSTDKKNDWRHLHRLFLKDYQMIQIPHRIEVQICSHCNSKLEEGKWLDENIPEEEVIYRALEKILQSMIWLKMKLLTLKLNN